MTAPHNSQPGTMEARLRDALEAARQWISVSGAANANDFKADMAKIDAALAESVSFNAPELPDPLTPRGIDRLFERNDLYTARAVFARLRNFGYSLVKSDESPAQCGVQTVDDAMVERAWAAVVGSDVAPICFNAAIIRADLRDALIAALALPSADRGSK